MSNSAIVTFTDPYEHQRAIRAGAVKVFVTAPGEYQAELARIDLHRLWMQRGRESLPRIFHSAVSNSRSPIFFLTDARQAPVRHSRVELAPGEIMVYGPAAEHYHRTLAECRWGTMSLTPDDLAAAGRAIAGHDLTAPSVTRRIRPSPHLLARLLDLHEAVGRLAATVPDILAHPEVARALEQELVRAMVACLTEDTAAKTHDLRRRRTLVMRRFEELLAANQDTPLHLADVCAALGVSGRALRFHCLEHLGMSPLRYLWLRRMHLVRRALTLADPADTTVTTIATDHGFWELGRFAVAYKNLFGESPSATLHSAPAALPPAGLALDQRTH